MSSVVVIVAWAPWLIRTWSYHGKANWLNMYTHDCSVVIGSAIFGKLNHWNVEDPSYMVWIHTLNKARILFLSCFYFFCWHFYSFTMFRCVASNIRLAPLCKKQPHLLLRTKVNGFQPSLPRRFFTSSPSCRRQAQGELKEQAATATTTTTAAAAAASKKKTDINEVKKLFRLARPEAKSIAGKQSKPCELECVHD